MISHRSARQDVRRLSLALAVATVLPFAWEESTVAAHAGWSLRIAVVLAALIAGATREPTPLEVYAAALPRAVALDVHLAHARAATMHLRGGRSVVTFTWREARTELLDVTGSVLATLSGNALDAGWTTSLELDDPSLAQRLHADVVGGSLTLHAVVGLDRDPWARVGNAPVMLEHCVIDFASGCSLVTTAAAASTSEA